MKRRDFISRSASGLALAGIASGISGARMRALASSPVLNQLQKLVAGTDRVLVVVQLAGGNDGLNTVIPVDDSVYYNSRKNISIAKNQALSLRDGLSLHPAMTGFHDLFQDGRLSIVQNVSYPNPDRSHFRGTDIWLSATDADVFKNTGWMGRYLETLAPGFPTTMPAEPLAIQIGESLSLGFRSDAGSLGITFRDPVSFYNLVDQGENTDYDASPSTSGGAELDFVRSVEKASEVYSKVVKAAADKVKTNKVSYPTSNPLAQSLQIVSRLIAAGLGTRIYLVNINGTSFDTHYNQGGASGAHATLLSYLSEGIKLFLDDCEQLGTANRVAGITFSEFGRRVAENGSLGTDHGTAAPMFVFGKSIIPSQILGHNPDLVNLDERGDLLVQYDFRQIYSAVLKQWFGSDTSTESQVLFRDFSDLPLFDIGSDVRSEDNSLLQNSMQINPNPAFDQALLHFNLPIAAECSIDLYDLRGQRLFNIAQASFNAGDHFNTIPLRGINPGTYFVRIRAAHMDQMKALQVVR